MNRIRVEPNRVKFNQNRLVDLSRVYGGAILSIFGLNELISINFSGRGLHGTKLTASYFSLVMFGAQWKIQRLRLSVPTDRQIHTYMLTALGAVQTTTEDKRLHDHKHINT